MAQYGSDERCEFAFRASRRSDGIACPACCCGVRSSFHHEGHSPTPRKRWRPSLASSMRPLTLGSEGLACFEGAGGYRYVRVFSILALQALVQ